MKKHVVPFAIGLIVASLTGLSWAQSATFFTNGGFESPDINKGASQGSMPDGWVVFSSTESSKPGITDSQKKGGLQSIRFKIRFMKRISDNDKTEPNAFQGLAQEFVATAGHHYSFIANVMNDTADPIIGAAFGQISIEWQDAVGKEVTRSFGPTWNFQLSSSRWEKQQVDADPPDTAVKGRAVVTFFSKDSKGMGTFYLDDCELIDRAK